MDDGDHHPWWMHDIYYITYLHTHICVAYVCRYVLRVHNSMYYIRKHCCYPGYSRNQLISVPKWTLQMAHQIHQPGWRVAILDPTVEYQDIQQITRMHTCVMACITSVNIVIYTKIYKTGFRGWFRGTTDGTPDHGSRVVWMV